MNNFKTYFLIGKILALDVLPDQGEFIKKQVQEGSMVWERFVLLADHHRVLQAIFPKLRDHKLQEYFPEKVMQHLKYIFDLNSARNLEIIKQTKKLTTILSKEGITPLYMKGVGNILNGVYKYPGERLLHDIDFLVPEERFEDAAEVLFKDGYKSNYRYNPGLIYQLKHYPILFKPGEPVYAEIHRMPIGQRYTRYFNTEMVLGSSKHPVTHPNCLVMSIEHSIIHNFLHAQFEDHARIYARQFMRNIYDMFLLSDHKDPEVVLSDFGHFRRASSGYLDITYDTFDIRPLYRLKPPLFLHTYRLRYHLNLRSRFIHITSLLVIRLIWGYLVNPVKSISDKELRLRLINKLRDPKWYKKQVTYYRKVLGIGKKNYK
jgi:hypothetical protein